MLDAEHIPPRPWAPVTDEAFLCLQMRQPVQRVTNYAQHSYSVTGLTSGPPQPDGVEQSTPGWGEAGQCAVPALPPARCVAWAMYWACVHLPTCEQDDRDSEPHNENARGEKSCCKDHKANVIYTRMSCRSPSTQDRHMQAGSPRSAGLVAPQRSTPCGWVSEPFVDQQHWGRSD